MDPMETIVDTEQIIEHQLSCVVKSNLFDEQAPFLNAFFRFQLGSNTFDGYEFAMEAWRRVAAVNQNASAEGQSLESLRIQKDAVKRELKLFDVHFAKFYGRQPSRLDKECLRRLYEFHKQLKAYIAAEEVKAERRSSALQMAESQANSSNRPDALTMVSGSTQENNEQLMEDMDVRVLKAEKRALKIKLRRFEDEFVRTHGHKPQSYQEVGVIREDYSRYKFLKEALQARENPSSSPQAVQPPPHGMLPAQQSLHSSARERDREGHSDRGSYRNTRPYLSP